MPLNGSAMIENKVLGHLVSGSELMDAYHLALADDKRTDDFLLRMGTHLRYNNIEGLDTLGRAVVGCLNEAGIPVKDIASDIGRGKGMNALADLWLSIDSQYQGEPLRAAVELIGAAASRHREELIAAARAAEGRGDSRPWVKSLGQRGALIDPL